MLQDEEFEQLMLSDERVKALGFRPQKEILTNHLLPYCEELDEESNRFFAQVKTNFAKAVMLREMKPACGVWSSRLIKYIRIYGLKFGKEDHIDFIKLAYELVLIPELEPCKVQKFATLFVMLTKKKYLISPEELVLPWRPLYDLGKRLFEKNSSTIGMFHYISPKSGNQETSVLGMVRKLISGHGFDDILGLFGLAPPADESATSLDSTYMSMVNCAKPYFDVSATKEMLEVFMPYAMRWGGDNPVIGSLGFLPVGLPPKYAAQGHELWFDKLMTILDTCHNAQCGDPDIFILFANLAKKNPGAVDWTPHVPKMFTRFLHALNLPVSYKDMQHCKHLSLVFKVPQVAAIGYIKDPIFFLNLLNINVDDMKNVAKWIVWTINPDGVILKHLRSFLAGVESYLHSANSGRWSFKLRDLLRKLAGEFLNRVRFEREKKFRETWLNKTPEAYKLRDEDITEFVMIVLEPTFQAVYSRSGSLDISIALQNLATLRPAIVIPPLIEKLRTSLTSLTEPHRVTVAMSAVAAVARPMLRGADADYPEGPRQVVPLLMAVLPGLDPNDIKKTIVTLHFILMFSCMVTYIDCSSAHEYWPDLTEDELLTCELTAQFEDFILVLLDKLFTFIESSVQEHVRLETKDSDAMKSKMDAVMETAISCAVCSVLTQCSPKIFKEALRKFKAFATETTYETNVSGSMIGALLKVFARINPEATLAAFLPQLCQELQELLASDEALHEENPPRDLVYRLVLFMEVVSCDGTVLMKYMDQILPVLDRALKLHATYALSPACDALANILSALSAMDLKEWKCLIKDYGTAPEKWLPIREWGNGCALKDVKFQWHVPSAEEAACAQMLIDRYVKAEVSRLQQWLSDERPMCRERRLRSLKIINCGFACSKFLPPPNEDPILLMESQVPATNIPFTNGVKHQVYLDGENMRVAITHLLLKVQAKMLAENTEDPRGLDLLLQVWERVIVMKNSRSGSTLEGKLRSYGALERAFDGRGGVGGKGAARLRMVLADAVRLQDEARLDLVCDAGIAPSALQALHAVYRLSVNRYSSIRRPAQSCLYRMLTNYPYSYRALIPEVVQLLGSVGDDDEGHARHKGALYILLGPKMAPLIAKQDWAAIRAIWPAILRAPLSEKLSIHRLEQAFSEVLHRYFPAINTRLTVTEGSVAAAKRLLTDDQVNDPEFTEQLAKATDTEKAASANFEKVYLELINELVDIAESSSVQWRRLELVMQMLIFCASIQTPYPPRAVRLFAKCLLHENVIVRKLAQKLMFLTLKQRKRKLKKIEVDPYEVAGIERPETHIPGYRKDLEWVVWSKDKEIKTDEEWDRPWLRNHTYGFYSWPKKIEVAAPISEQNFAWDTKPEDMEEGERYIYEFFTDEENVAKLIGFFTAEEKKGKDKFNATRCTMIRFLFAHFGRRITERLIEAAVECAAKPEESKQRFAAEVACAAMRAPRYWRRHDALALQRDALRILTNGLTSVIPETQEDWGTAVATAADKMDPLRNSQLIQQLLQLCSPPPSARPAPDQETSFVASARLYAFQGALVALSWRGAPLAVEFLERLEAANYIQHPYENVRATVGSILMMIFNLEVVFPGGEPSPLAPSLQRFLDSVQPRLAALYDEKGDIVIKSAAAITSAACSSRGQVAPKAGFAMMQDFRALLHAHRDHTHTHTDPQTAQPGGSETELQLREIEEDSPLEKELTERLQTALHLTGEAVTPAHAHHERAVNLLTTVLTGCMGVVVRGVNTNLETQLKLVPLACALASRGSSQPHEELPRAAGGFLAALAQAYYRGETFDCVLTVLEELANGRSWWARLACLDFAIPLLFYGLPLLCDRPERAVRAEAFALKLMRDSRVEVRQSAAKVLTGLMHCRALPDEDKTLKSLIRSCRSKELDERHCGVLGLCAHMSSRPYSLGPRLGDVLAELAKHTNAPDPIPATIRTALADFKRTHQDDWPKHREQLTEEELDLLADLTSPPSYCA